MSIWALPVCGKISASMTEGQESKAIYTMPVFFGKAMPRGPFKSSPKVCSIPLRVGTDGFGHFVKVVGWNRSSLSSMSTGILMKTGVG